MPSSYDCLINEPIIPTKSTFPAQPSWCYICVFYQYSSSQREKDNLKPMSWITYATGTSFHLC